MTARPCSRFAKNAGNAELHHVEGFVDRDRRAALDHGARLGQLGGLVQRRRLDDAVAGCSLTDRALRDGAVSLDLVNPTRKRIARIDHRRSQLGEPGRPLLHDSRLLRRRVRHASAVIHQQISHSLLLLAVFERKSAINASARFNRSLLAGALSQRLSPEGCGIVTMSRRLPKFLSTLSSSSPGPRKRSIALCPSGLKTSG